MDFPAERPKLMLIEGGGRQSSGWLDLPRLVLARHFQNPKEIISYRVSTIDIQKLHTARRRQPIFELWSIVVGEPPPVDNVSYAISRAPNHKLISLSDAHACFRGVRRPIGEDERGWDVLAYVSKPRWFFAFRPHMVCQAEVAVVPSDLVFVTYVILDWPAQASNSRAAAGQRPSAQGVIVRGEFVEADPLEPDLPADFRERYRKRQW
jgi:hypothetical protein